MGGLTSVLEAFESESIVEGRMFVNGTDEGVRIFYRPKELEIEGFGTETFPALRFSEGKIEIWSIENGWDKVTEAKDLDLYRLLDPRLFIELANNAIELGQGMFRLSYLIDSFDAPLAPVPARPVADLPYDLELVESLKVRTPQY